MNPMMEQSEHENRFPRQLQRGKNVNLAAGHAPPPRREERMRRWEHRLEKLFARQAY